MTHEKGSSSGALDADVQLTKENEAYMDDSTKLRIRVAELCGDNRDRWMFSLFPDNQPTINCDGYASICDAEREWKKLSKEGAAVSKIEKYKLPVKALPDYPNDLNAMYEAEGTLIFSKRQRYYQLLGDLHPATKAGIRVADIELVRSSALQRAKAFVAVMEASSVPKA